jgi:hypothetical protein
MTKKYILKPGMHQFVPGSAAVHSNSNITDEEAEWYIHKYPHIANLFIDAPKQPALASSSPTSIKKRRKRTTQLIVKSSLSGGKA